MTSIILQTPVARIVSIYLVKWYKQGLIYFFEYIYTHILN